MTKVKKTITTALLAIMLVMSSLILIACGDSVTANNVFESLETTIQTYKDSSMFITGGINNIATDFFLQNFKEKLEGGTENVDGENYFIFVATGLNYIENNYSYLENSKAKYNYSSLSKKIDAMNDAYDEVYIEFENLTNLPSTIDYNIYNGYYARYKQYTKFFIDEIYNVASSLGDFIVNYSGVCDSTKEGYQEETALDLYLDYNFLLISQDYKDFLMDSCQGATLDEDLVVTIQEFFDYYAKSFFSKMNSTFSLSVERSEVQELLEAIKGDRENAKKSLDKFSFYEYCKTYENSLTAYSKSNNKAEIYYVNISNYYFVTLMDLFDYLEGVIA